MPSFLLQEIVTPEQQMEAMMDKKMKDLKEQLELDHQRSLESKIAQILNQQVVALTPLAGAEHGSCG